MPYLNSQTRNQLPLDAVIFDLDGTLVDSETLSWRVFEELWSELEQSPVPSGLKEVFKGLRYVQRVEYLEQRFQLAIPAASWVEKYRQRFYEAFDRDGIPSQPGADRLLRQLNSVRLPLALATNSGSEYVQRVLGERGWTDLFSVTAVRDDVERLKPFPDVYLCALGRLGVSAQAAVAVEDSSAGVESACAAGLRVVGVRNGDESACLDGSLCTVSSLDELTFEYFRTLA